MINQYKTRICGIECIDEAGKLLREGELVAFPTETVYGLGASALDEKAVEKIFIAKGRPQDNPLIVHIAMWQDAEKYAEVTKDAETLFKAFSPGPLTLILKKKDMVPSVVTAGRDNVGIRVPMHETARLLIEKAGVPIAAPSANISSRVSPTTAEHVYEDMQGRIPLIIDGGQCGVGIESTVLDMTKEIPVILRPGAITAENLTKYLPKVLTHKGEVLVAEAPGMKYRHYAPKVPCVQAKTPEGANKKYDEELSKGNKPVIIAREGFVTGSREFISLGRSAGDYAKNIYKTLREAEKKYDILIIESLDGEELEKSIMNRMNKATQGVWV